MSIYITLMQENVTRTLSMLQINRGLNKLSLISLIFRYMIVCSIDLRTLICSFINMELVLIYQ